MLHLSKIPAHADPGQECLQGLTAKSTAGWVLLYLQLRSVVDVKELTAEVLHTNPECQDVLTNASLAACEDLEAVLQPGSDTESDSGDEYSRSAVVLVNHLRNQRASLVDTIIGLAAVADQLEEEHGLRFLANDLDDEASDLCTFLVLFELFSLCV